jgi:glycosyltransferase involved in cell wall biosynthesis
MMGYAIFDIEVTRPMSDLLLSPADTGAAILVRRKGVPIGFWMQEANGNRHLAADDLARRIGAELGVRIVAQTIRDEMTASSASTALPPVTIAICTKDRPEGVERLLQSLRPIVAGMPEGSGHLEILLVDNAPSDDSTRDLAGQWPEVRYVREPRPGLDFARNRALREARGEILAFLDDDVTADRYWLAGLADAWAANRDAAAFTGLVLPMELDTEAQIVFEQRGGFRRGFDRIRYGPVLSGNPLYPSGAGSFGAGANMAFRTAVLRRMGGFDEALDTGAPVPGGGDLDAFYRIIRAGHVLVYEPRFLVFHQHRREMAALGRQYRRSWGFGFMCYLMKCIKSDPQRRIPLMRLIVWWFEDRLAHLLRELKKSARGEGDLPPSMLLGELWGGVIGLLGGYARSQRRVEKIRKRFP